LQQCLAASAEALALPAPAVSITLLDDKHPALATIRHLLQNRHDLVIKAADMDEQRHGFQSLDMQLLRKCPAPLWLCRPGKTQALKIAVAIDPQYEDKAGEQLSIDLLQLALQLNNTLGQAPLNVVSCWHSELEAGAGNPFIQLDADTVAAGLESARQEHYQALQQLFDQAQVDKNGIAVFHQKGQPRKLIPQMAKQESIDLMIMGTVARTGIPGFIIGNTAENILQQLECSVLALKPAGFISPVKG
ncbi:MAG TPA: universal stress protein, partial [Pseudomonadales bacterium]